MNCTGALVVGDTVGAVSLFPLGLPVGLVVGELDVGEYEGERLGFVVGFVLMVGEELGKYSCVGLTDIDGSRLGS